jgi:hypothetical protein
MNRMTNNLVLAGSLFVGLLLTEVASRYIMPISPGAQLLTPEGEPVGHFSYQANTMYRQVSAEFDAFTTIDRYGNRIPTPVGNPDTIFVGDSFTFGHGLADKDTFAMIYCTKLKRSCANLGKPGLGTTEELDILEHFLAKEGWRPDVVKLVFFGMTESLMSGNDIYDNYLWALRNKSHAASTEGPGRAKLPSSRDYVRDMVKKLRNSVLEYSNLGRFLYFSLGNQIRTLFSPPTSQSALETGLTITRKQIDRLVKLSEIYHFQPELYLIHPVQDLIRGTIANTIETLESAVPGQKFISSAGVFEPNSSQYYFPFDGHLNISGAKRFSEFLIERER